MYKVILSRTSLDSEYLYPHNTYDEALNFFHKLVAKEARFQSLVSGESKITLTANYLSSGPETRKTVTISSIIN